MKKALIAVIASLMVSVSCGTLFAADTQKPDTPQSGMGGSNSNSNSNSGGSVTDTGGFGDNPGSSGPAK